MPTLSYDLHIHSCLSPCGEDEMTPANIIGMAQLIGLDIIALTDHNTCRNCKAAMQFGVKSGIIVIPGMELTTSEEVHVICLFPTLEDAMAFDSYVYIHLLKIKNQESIFGHQYQMDENDQIVASEENLLITATSIPFSETYALVKKYHGIIFPAHIDKNTNSLLSNLGFIPDHSSFTCVELKDVKNYHSLKSLHPYLKTCRVITNSDAHMLLQLHEACYSLHVKNKSIPEILRALETPPSLEE